MFSTFLNTGTKLHIKLEHNAKEISGRLKFNQMAEII